MYKQSKQEGSIEIEYMKNKNNSKCSKRQTQTAC
jgi:hypothetical protein